MGHSVNNPFAQVLGDTQLGVEKAEEKTEPLLKRQRKIS